MSVNRSYWSGSETKTVYGIDVELPLFPVDSRTVRTYPYFANSFVAKTKDNGVDWTQPIDTSYSFCRTDANYCGCKSVVVCGYATSYNPAAQRSRKYNIGIEAYDIGLGIKSGVTSQTDSYIQYTASSTSTLKCTTIPNTNTENKKPDTLTYNSETFYKYSGNFAPILKANPRDYMLVIMVDCAKLREGKTLSDFATDGNSIFNGTAKCDLKTYLLYYYAQGYTIITGVWCFVVAKPTDPINIGSIIAPVLYSTNTIDIDYTGSDGDAYTFSAKLPSMFNPVGGTTLKYTPDDEHVIASSFSLQDNLRYGEIVIAGTLNGGSSYITYPYKFGPIHVGEYFKIYENANKTYLLSAATVDDFGGLEAFREWCRKQTAYFGLPFRENRDFTNVDEALTDERIMWGIIDSGGVTHGEYTIGIGNTKNPMYNSDNMQDDSGWKPGGGGGPTSGGDHDKEQSSYGGDNFSMNNRTMAKFGLHRYVMEEGEFSILMQFYKECLDYKGARKKYIDFLVDKGVSSDDAAELWNAWFPDRSSYLAQMYGDLGYGEDPHKNLVSILALPVDKTEIQGSEENINTGYYTTAKTFTLNTTLRSGASYDVPYAPVTDGFAATAHVLNSTVKVIDLVRDHKIEHPKGWDDFRCYEPYSRCELYIPYHGNVTLSLAQCLGKYITVQVAVDLITGASYAVVLMRGSSGPYAIYQALPGQMGFNVPYSQDSSGYNAGSLMNLSAASQSNKIEKYRNVANAIVATGSAIAGKSALGAVGSVLGGIATGQQLDVQSDLIDFQIEHSADGRAVANSPSTLTGWAVHQTCQLIWHFPNMLAYNDANYANLVGYATARTGAVGSFKGFTKFNNVNLSALTCLDEERNAIMAALQSGVYL